MTQALSLFEEPARRPYTSIPSAAAHPRVMVWRDLDSLEPVWCALEAHGCATVFQSWAVFQSWVIHIAQPQRINWVVIGLVHPATGAPLLLLPLAVRRDSGLQVIEFADFGVSDFNGPVMARTFRPDVRTFKKCWHDILGAMPAGDVLRLNKMPHSVNGLRNPLHSLPGVHRMKLSAFGTELGLDWKCWARETIEPKLLNDLEARARKLEKRGRVAFAVTGDRAAAQPAFEAMCAQRAERHAQMKRPNILARPGFSDFYRSLLDDGGNGGPALMASLTLDGEVIATGYGLARDQAFHMIFPTFKADRWRNYSPGLQIFVRTMKWASENGFTYFDFTIGAESFKRDLGATERPLFEKMVALSPRGLPLIMSSHLKRVARHSPRVAQSALGVFGMQFPGA